MWKRRTFLLLLFLTIGALCFSSSFTFTKDDVFVLDRPFIFPYSEPATIASEVTQYLSFLSPLALMSVTPKEEWFSLGLMYGAASALSFGARQILKLSVERGRPYLLDANTPISVVNSPDSFRSFPSGHTIMAFTGASFLTTVLLQKQTEQSLKIPLIIASVLLATATGVLRVTSGNHYMTDVLAGAAIGTLCGVAIPLIFQRR